MILHLQVNGLQLHTDSDSKDQYVAVTFSSQDANDYLSVTMPVDKAPRTGQRFKLELTEEN